MSATYSSRSKGVRCKVHRIRTNVIATLHWETWFEPLLSIGTTRFYIGGDGTNLLGNRLHSSMVGVSGCLPRYSFWKVRGSVGDCGLLLVVYALSDPGSYISAAADKSWE